MQKICEHSRILITQQICMFSDPSGTSTLSGLSGTSTLPVVPDPSAGTLKTWKLLIAPVHAEVKELMLMQDGQSTIMGMRQPTTRTEHLGPFKG